MPVIHGADSAPRNADASPVIASRTALAAADPYAFDDHIFEGRQGASTSMSTTDAAAVRAVILARLLTELHLAADSVETDLARSVADADLRTIYSDPTTGSETGSDFLWLDDSPCAEVRRSPDGLVRGLFPRSPSPCG